MGNAASLQDRWCRRYFLQRNMIMLRKKINAFMAYRVEKVLLLACAVIMTSIAGAQLRDTLFFTNGQILIGELRSMSLGKANFDADKLQVLSIKADRLKTIHASANIYRLETINREIFYTYLLPGEDGKVQIYAYDTTINISIEDISVLYPLKGKSASYWQGKASVGYSYTRSSQIGRFNSDYSVGYTTKKIELASSGSVIITQTDSSFEADNANASLIGSYLFDPVWDVNVFFNYQRNLEQGLARRYQEGSGVGLNFVSAAHVRAKGILGVVLSQEKNTEDVYTPTQVEIPLIFIFDFFKFSKPDLTVNMRQSFFVGITQWGRFRQEGQLDITYKIITDFSINVQLYDNYDNQPPGTNSAKLDYGIVFGLQYKFSR